MRDGSLLRRPRPAAVRAAAGPVLDLGVGFAVGLAVLLTAITLSVQTSEDFSDAFTGRMVFRATGEKTIEIAGAVLAVVLGAAAHEACRWLRHRRRRVPGTAALPPATGPAAVDPAATHAVPSPAPASPGVSRAATVGAVILLAVVAALAAALLSVGATTVLGAFGVVVPRGVALVAAAVTVGASAVPAVRRLPGVRAKALGAVVVCQGFFAGGAFVLLPPPVLTADGAAVLVRSWAGPLGWALAGALAALVAAAAVRAARRSTADDGARPSAVVAPAVVVGAVALTAAVPVPFVPDDGYHFGEFVTPPFLLADFGQMPYVDQVPARGILVNYLPAWIAQALTEPWAGLAPVGFAVLALALLAAVFWLVRDLAGPGWAAALTVAAAFAAVEPKAVNDLTMVVLLLALDRAARTWALPATAAAFAGSVVLAVLLAPAQGLAYALTGAVLLALRAVQRPPARREWALAAAAAAGVVVAALPLWGMLRGATTYVLDQGAVNDQVWGIPWADSLDTSTTAQLALTGVRELGRAAVLPGLAVVLVLTARGLPRLRSVPTLPLWLVLGAYSALQLPRALGRIDPGELSRIGALTLVVGSLVVPLVLLTQPHRPRAPLVGVVTAALLAPLVLGVEIAPPPPVAATGVLADRASGARPDPGLTPVSREPGTAALSGAVVSARVYEHTVALAADYDRLLPAGAPRTLVDLTNYQAGFRYLETDNPVATAAVYNITTAAVELDALRRLTEHPPAVALLWHPLAETHDGGGVALRTPLLFAWILQTYTPITCRHPGDAGYAIWGVRDGVEPPGCTLARIERQKTELLGAALDAWTSLRSLPRAWAAPRSRVSDVLSVTEEVTPTMQTTATGVTVSVPLPHRDLRSAIVTLDLTCGGWTDSTITWAEAPTSPAGSATAALGGGRVLLPLGSYTALVRADGLDAVRIDIPGADACEIGAPTTWLTRDRITRAADLGLLTATAPARVLPQDTTEEAHA